MIRDRSWHIFKSFQYLSILYRMYYLSCMETTYFRLWKMFFTKAPLKQKQSINFNSGCKQAIIILFVTVILLKQNITVVQKCVNYTLFWIIRFKIVRHEISRFTHFYYHSLKQLYSNKKQGMLCCYDGELNLNKIFTNSILVCLKIKK